MLPMEQETIGMLVVGFCIVMGVSFLFVVLLWAKERKSEYRSAFGWMIAHLIIFSSAVSCFLKAISNRPLHPAMASEGNSLWLGIGGVLWAISMILFLAGIVSFCTRKRP
ncbi:hypothetical protein GC098_07465 [Paenibacillus sp. LMG 31458]|uniref:Uncharacterized protein n=2 Tax=Paenibacillus phytorum TaxID=2654977 RepID=A0ABX1XRW0_9BACL|nr:hypothetical protein [Paenibacillus sp. Root444D2]KQX50207.1 hypothetical protein ASD40_35840 [Paenibacillus sp. Root444D2]NOU71261.1 hypothetical protein [Paenibacillus phytorum]